MTTSQAKAKLPFGSAASSFVLQRFPYIRRAIWRTLYNTTHRFVTAEDFVFMNLGYASDDDHDLPVPVPVDLFPRRLYERVVCSVELASKDVLEVGCGRGGGAAHIHATFAPKSMVGVDLAPIGIESCKASYPREGLRFQTGDAMQLPFEEASFDAVINVESSHCYPSRAQFFAEVRRVLRPGGYFLYADAFWPHLDNVPVEAVIRMLHESGLSLIEEEDISKNVLRARTIMGSDPTFAATLNRWTPQRKISPAVRNEAYALPGSFHYESLANGRATYRRWTLRKPGGAGASLPT